MADNTGARVINPEALESQLTGNINNRIRALAQGATFSYSDEAEAAARAAVTGETYDEALEKIRREYAEYVAANPAEATGLEIAGGVGSTFVPGVGWVGHGVKAATGLGKITSPFLRTVAAGSLAGGVSGFGAGEGGFGERAQTGALGTLFGGATAGALHGAVNIVPRGLGALRSLFAAPTEDSATRTAQEVLDTYVLQTGKTYEELIEQARQDAAMGIPTALGQLSPELSRLSEAVMLRPTRGGNELIKELAETQTGARERVTSAVTGAFPPTRGYYTELEGMQRGLRDRAQPLYEVAYKAGEVIDDPRINEILRDPDFANAFSDALVNSRRLETAARLEGKDPSTFQLQRVYDVNFDAQGNPTGSVLNNVTPNLRTLDAVKRALDAKITRLFRSGASNEAAPLREMRNALVSRLDDLVDEYRVARGQYAGDMEIIDAMEAGRNYKNMSAEQLASEFPKLTEGEQRAFQTGVLESIIRPVEETSTNRNWAQQIIGSPAQRERLQTVLPPDEYNLMRSALEREAAVYGQTRSALSGSQTAARTQAIDAIDSAIENATGPADILNAIRNTNGGFVSAAWYALTKLPQIPSISKTVYDRLANILKTGGPDDIAQALFEIRSAAESAAARGARSSSRQQRVATGLGAAIGPPPDTQQQQERERLFNEQVSTPIQAPDLSRFMLPGEEPLTEPFALPVQPETPLLYQAPDLSRFRLENEAQQ
jgi:hypothetical protein